MCKWFWNIGKLVVASDATGGTIVQENTEKFDSGDSRIPHAYPVTQLQPSFFQIPVAYSVEESKGLPQGILVFPVPFCFVEIKHSVGGACDQHPLKTGVSMLPWSLQFQYLAQQISQNDARRFNWCPTCHSRNPEDCWWGEWMHPMRRFDPESWFLGWPRVRCMGEYETRTLGKVWLCSGLFSTKNLFRQNF